MTDQVELFRRSIDRVTALVDGIPPDGWTAPTPCDDWNVRELLNHLAYEQLWAPHLLDGQTIAEVGDRYDGDVLGDDPGATWRAASAESIAAFAVPGALDRTVHLSFGDEKAEEYLAQMLMDATVHGWDLARGTGQPDEMDELAVQAVWDTWSSRGEMIRGSGVFAGSVPVPDDADLQTRLLALLGRRA